MPTVARLGAVLVVSSAVAHASGPHPARALPEVALAGQAGMPAVGRLADVIRGRHIGLTMTRWPAHRIRALLLALLLALGMGSTIVQGGLMAAEMAVSAKAGLPGPSGCDACGDGETLAGMCLSVCGSAAQVILPGEPVALRSARRAGFQAAYLVLGGRSNSPDHGPPKLPTLG